MIVTCYLDEDRKVFHCFARVIEATSVLTKYGVSSYFLVERLSGSRTGTFATWKATLCKAGKHYRIT